MSAGKDGPERNLSRMAHEVSWSWRYFLSRKVYGCFRKEYGGVSSNIRVLKFENGFRDLAARSKMNMDWKESSNTSGSFSLAVNEVVGHTSSSVRSLVSRTSSRNSGDLL